MALIDDSHGFAAYPNLFLGTDQTSLINNISTPKKNIHQIDIYPNPSTGIIHIQAPYNFSEVIISDIVGKTIFQQQFRSNDETIFLPEYFSGIYFIKIYFEEQVICNKIILAK